MRIASGKREIGGVVKTIGATLMLAALAGCCGADAERPDPKASEQKVIESIMGMYQAFQQADPQILEPIYQVTVLCPDDLTGGIISDLQTRRAMMEGMDTEGHFTKIIARVPLAEMDDYSSSLRSITQGRAKFRIEFLEYAPVPFEIQRKLIDEYNKAPVKEEV